MEQKCKIIETCVLYIDIRKSTDLNLSHRRGTMAKLYSSFVRAMARAGGYYSGKVRNIIGDRLMVLFNVENCFSNAINTAILMNSVCQHILDKEFSHNAVKCGIGIDYGKMLVTKAGIIKNGTENTSNKSLVWLGRPANVASKLTDVANKTTTVSRNLVREGYYFPNLENKWFWINREFEEFIDMLQPTFSNVIRHGGECFSSFFRTNDISISTNPPILITKDVFNGIQRENPLHQVIRENYLTVQPHIKVSGYNDEIYGGDPCYEIFADK